MSEAAARPETNNGGGAELPSIGVVRFAAMNYLARREHSAFELRQKLVKRFSNTEAVDAAIAQLRDEHLQSDRRFAESFIAARTRRGQGPIRIVGELKQRGVDPDIIDAVLDLPSNQWIELARTVIDKKFGKAPPGHIDRAKQSRFLYYRGFTSDQIQAILES